MYACMNGCTCMYSHGTAIIVCLVFTCHTYVRMCVVVYVHAYIYIYIYIYI